MSPLGSEYVRTDSAEVFAAPSCERSAEDTYVEQLPTNIDPALTSASAHALVLVTIPPMGARSKPNSPTEVKAITHRQSFRPPVRQIVESLPSRHIRIGVQRMGEPCCPISWIWRFRGTVVVALYE